MSNRKRSNIDFNESLETFPRNPGRGHTPYPWIVCKTDGTTRALTEEYFDKMGLSTPMYDLSAFSSGNAKTQEGYISPTQKPDRVGGVNRDIDNATLAAIESAFAGAKKQGVQLIPRFSYAWDATVGAEPDDIKWIIRHIEQLCGVINKYAGTVISVEGGMYGPWGEMHSSVYCAPECEKAIISAWLGMLDPKVTLQVRNIGCICHYLEADVQQFKAMLPIGADNAAYRLGLYNDGYLGNGVDTGTFNAPGDDETIMLYRESANEFMRAHNVHLPYGGDIAYTSIGWIKGTIDPQIPAAPIYDDTFVKELYDTHVSYLRNIVDGPTVVSELEGIEFTHRHDFDGMPDVSAYYGKSLQKFMLDHIGYRYVLRDAQTYVCDGKAEFCGKVENVGFGNELGVLVSELIVVSPSGEASFNEVDIDLRKWNSREYSEYSLSYNLPDNAEGGEYRAYLRFGSMKYADAAKDACTVLFANENIHEKTYGANYIGSFRAK